MLPEDFAIFGGLFASLGGIYYLYETITGKSQPNRVTWLLWGIFPMITFIAQRAQGVEGLSWVSLTSGVTPLLIFGASFLNKKSYWKTKPLDYVCMGAGIVGMVLWGITSNANLAIAFAILADIAAAIPSVIKCLKHPKTESWAAYTISAVGFGFSLLAVHDWAFQNSAFVIYLFILQVTMGALASGVFKRKHIDK